MVTEAQKKAFKEKLDKVFSIENPEEENKLKNWLRIVYYKYKNPSGYMTSDYRLCEEHLLSLKTKLEEENLTLDDFEKAHGKLEILIEIKKNKPTTKVKTLEELTKDRDDLEKAIRALENKHTKRNKALYHLSDKEYEEIGQQLDALYEDRKEVCREIEELNRLAKETDKCSEAAAKRIAELLKESEKKDAELAKLKEENEYYKQERAVCSTKLREEYEKRYEDRCKEIKEQHEEKLKTDLEERLKKINQREEETKKSQKTYIKNLILKGTPLSIENMKSELRLVKISANKLDVAINELRNEIPGIIKTIDNDSYVIGAKATNRRDALKDNKVCPRISNVFEGTIQFIVRADLHLPLDLTEDKMKGAFEPLFEYSSSNGKIPIVDLGDFVETTRRITYQKWQRMDKEAIELSYNFFENYAKVISESKIKHFQLIGNHEQHAYLVGIDPVEIMNNNADNITLLGIDKGAFMLGCNKVGVFHGIETIPFNSKQDLPEIIGQTIGEELKKIAKGYIYSLVSHYHFGIHNPTNGYSLIDNTHDDLLLFTAELEDGEVKRMFVQGLHPNGERTSFKKDAYRIEIYNSGYQYRKKSH